MPHRPIPATYAALLLAACGGSAPTTPKNDPTPVAAVTVTLGSTSVQVGTGVTATAALRDASNNALAGREIAWSSSNTAVATVNLTGMVTTLSVGTTTINATSEGQVGGALLTVTAPPVAQVPTTIVITPGAVAFGAIGKTRQLAASVTDATGTIIAAAPISWTRSGPGLVASVSASGLVTALAAGIGDSAVATSSTISAKAPISVTQVVTSVAITSASVTPDTVFSSTRTRQFSAAARDSNSNIVAGTAFAWTSSLAAVATVNATTGQVTAATTNGSTTIQATASGVSGSRPFVVRRIPAIFTMAPTSGAINTPGGTQLFTATVLDSAGGPIAPTWSLGSIGVVSLNPLIGAATTATASNNGATHVVMAVDSRRDSALITVTNQPGFPLARSVDIGNFFFRSVTNATQPAVDTVGVGGTVTWNWVGGTHGVESTGLPSFPSSTTKSSGSYLFTFNTPGTYTYDCSVHGVSMTGTVVVR